MNISLNQVLLIRLMNTKDKGNVGELVILSEFVKRGVPVSIPYGDNTRYDLIAEFNGKLNKIQVKYCSQVTKEGSILCKSASVNRDTGKRSTYESEVDYLAFYIKPWDMACLVPMSEIKKKTTFTIRNSPTKNGQSVGVHYVDDYLFDKMVGPVL